MAIGKLSHEMGRSERQSGVGAFKCEGRLSRTGMIRDQDAHGADPTHGVKGDNAWAVVRRDEHDGFPRPHPLGEQHRGKLADPSIEAAVVKSLRSTYQGKTIRILTGHCCHGVSELVRPRTVCPVFARLSPR